MDVWQWLARPRTGWKGRAMMAGGFAAFAIFIVATPFVEKGLYPPFGKGFYAPDDGVLVTVRDELRIGMVKVLGYAVLIAAGLLLVRWQRRRP